MSNLQDTNLEPANQNAQIIELLAAIYIQSCRNYDMLAIIADALKADVDKLKALHEAGETFAPEPSFKVEDEASDN